MRTPVLVLVLATACSGSGSAPGGAGRSDPPPAAAAAAGEPAVTLALWPGHWSKLEQLVAGASQLAPELAEPLAALRAELPSAWAVVRVLAREAGLGELPATVDGLDLGSPIVIAGLVPLQTAEAHAAAYAAGLGGGRPSAPAGFRHHAWLPARDPKGVAAALEQALAAAPAAKPDGFGDPDPGDLAVTRLAPGVYGDEGRLVRVAAAAGGVDVTIVTGHALAGLDAAGRARMLGEPARGPAALHPLMAAPAASLARLHVRLDQTGAAGAGTGMMKSVEALETFEQRDQRAAVFLQAYSEVMAAMLVADPASAVVTDAIFDVPAAAATPAVFLVTTDQGRELLRGDPALAAGTPVGIRTLDLVGLAARAPLPPALDRAATPQEAVTLFHECGWACASYMGLGNGVGLLRIAEKERPGSVAAALDEMIGELPLLGRVQLTLAGSVLVAEAFGPAPGAVERGKAIAPRATAAATPASRCHADALAALRTGFQAAVRATEDAAALAPMLDRVLADAAANLDCAAQDPALAPRVAHLREAIGHVKAAAAK